MPAAHAVLGRRLLVGGGKPPRVGEELGEGGPDRLARLSGEDARAIASWAPATKPRTVGESRTNSSIGRRSDGLGR